MQIVLQTYYFYSFMHQKRKYVLRFLCTASNQYGALMQDWLKGHEKEKAGLKRLKWVTKREYTTRVTLRIESDLC